MTDSKPEVAVIMGSASDWETMKHACDMLDQFEVPYVKQVISAHRTLTAPVSTVSRSSSPVPAAPRTFPAWSPPRPRCR